MKSIKSYLTVFLIFIIIIVLIYFVFNYYNKSLYWEEVYKQNELAYKDSLKTLNINNREIYHRYVQLKNLDSLRSIDFLKKQKQILEQQKTIVRLNTIISSSKYDSTNVVNDTIIYYFNQSTPFYRYSLKVKLPEHYLNLQFNDIPITTYVTLGESGEISSYLEIPDSLQPFLNIKDFLVVRNPTNEIKKPIDNKFKISPVLGYTDKKIFKGLIINYKKFGFMLASTKAFNSEDFVFAFSFEL